MASSKGNGIDLSADLVGLQALQQLISRFSEQVERRFPEARDKAAEWIEKRLQDRFATGGYGEWDEILPSSLKSRKVRKDDPFPPLTDAGLLAEQFSTPITEGLIGSGLLRFETDQPGAAALNNGYEVQTKEGEREIAAREFDYFSDDDIEGLLAIFKEEIDMDFGVGFGGGLSWL